MTENTMTERRFTLMAEDSFDQDEPGEILVTGNVHGEVHKGDHVTVLYPGRVDLNAEVVRIETGFEEDSPLAKDTAAGLVLRGIGSATLVRRYAVIAEEQKETGTISGRTVRNPYLLGISHEYDTWVEDLEYRNCLMYAVCHARYAVPIVYSEKKEDAGAAVRVRPNDYRFSSLRDPRTNKPVFPVFTDFPSFGRWTAFLAQHEPATKVMSFQEIHKILKGRYHGIVMNAFGPKAVFLNEKMLEELVNSPAYRQEFGKGNGLEQRQQSASQQLMLGYPAENPEVKAIREGLLAYAKADEDVRQINFLLKQEADNTLAYLVIVDCEQAKEQKIFSGIYREVGMYLKNIANMDFVRLENAAFAAQAMAMKAPLYKD